MDDILNPAPLVSVAMTTYNHERFVAQAIKSVLVQQARFPIELVIGDDASSDDTIRHIEALRTQAPEVVRTIIHPINIGANRNFESVLKECRGEFIALLEGDDYWTSANKIQVQADILLSNNNKIGTFHSVIFVDSLGKEIATIYPNPEKVAREIGTIELLADAIIPTASVMIRRNALMSLPDRYRNVLVSDWAMWVYASLRDPWIFFPKAMAARRVHEGGVWSGLSGAAQRAKHIELFHHFAEDLPQPFATVARQRLAQMHLAALERALADNRSNDARRELREVVRLLPYRSVGDSKRFANALWRALSPRTHQIAKRTLDLVRQNR
ncbi:MAG TPA: glycosyltransferase [Stellaceae bacterium]|nr:glycosyltransferase [Stellaceae bacterium]